jgi:hypothetical protein
VDRAPSRAGASSLLARHQVDRLWVTDVASVFAGIEELNAAITEAPTSGDPAQRAASAGCDISSACHGKDAGRLQE